MGPDWVLAGALLRFHPYPPWASQGHWSNFYPSLLGVQKGTVTLGVASRTGAFNSAYGVYPTDRLLTPEGHWYNCPRGGAL